MSEELARVYIDTRVSREHVRWLDWAHEQFSSGGGVTTFGAGPGGDLIEMLYAATRDAKFLSPEPEYPGAVVMKWNPIDRRWEAVMRDLSGTWFDEHGEFHEWHKLLQPRPLTEDERVRYGFPKEKSSEAEDFGAPGD